MPIPATIYIPSLVLKAPADATIAKAKQISINTALNDVLSVSFISYRFYQSQASQICFNETGLYDVVCLPPMKSKYITLS